MNVFFIGNKQEEDMASQYNLLFTRPELFVVLPRNTWSFGILFLKFWTSLKPFTVFYGKYLLEELPQMS